MSDQYTWTGPLPITFEQLMQFGEQREKIEAPFDEKVNTMIFSSKEEVVHFIEEIEKEKDAAVYAFVRETYGVDAEKFIKLLDEISGLHLDIANFTESQEVALDERLFELIKKHYGEKNAEMFKQRYLAEEVNAVNSIAFIQQRTQGVEFIAAAIQTGDLAEVQKLVGKDQSLLNTNCSGPLKPLHWAAWWNKVDIVEWLLEQKVPVDQLSDDTRTAMFLAALYGSEDVIQVLHRHGANVNFQDEDDETPLHSACYAQNGIATVSLLLKLGADPTIKNTEKQTAYDEMINPSAEVLKLSREQRLAIANVLEQAIIERTAKALSSKITPKM